MADREKDGRCSECGSILGHHPWCSVNKPEYEQKPGAVKPVWREPSMAGSYNAISSPAHYARFKIQPIDFIEANSLDFLQASVLKYLVRYPFKNGVEDLHKARDMLNRLIKREEEKVERPVGVSPVLGMGFTGETQPYDPYAECAHALMRDAGQDVDGQPATGDTKNGGNTTYRTE